MLICHSRSPFGAFAPSVRWVARQFAKMWDELSDEPEKWGCKSSINLYSFKY